MKFSVKMCKEAYERKLMWIQSSSKRDLAFIETGFRNWSKALEKSVTTSIRMI